MLYLVLSCFKDFSTDCPHPPGRKKNPPPPTSEIHAWICFSVYIYQNTSFYHLILKSSVNSHFPKKHFQHKTMQYLITKVVLCCGKKLHSLIFDFVEDILISNTSQKNSALPACHGYECRTSKRILCSHFSSYGVIIREVDVLTVRCFPFLLIDSRWEFTIWFSCFVQEVRTSQLRYTSSSAT